MSAVAIKLRKEGQRKSYMMTAPASYEALCSVVWHHWRLADNWELHHKGFRSLILPDDYKPALLEKGDELVIKPMKPRKEDELVRSWYRMYSGNYSMV